MGNIKYTENEEKVFEALKNLFNSNNINENRYSLGSFNYSSDSESICGCIYKIDNNWNFAICSDSKVIYNEQYPNIYAAAIRLIRNLKINIKSFLNNRSITKELNKTVLCEPSDWEWERLDSLIDILSKNALCRINLTAGLSRSGSIDSEVIYKLDDELWGVCICEDGYAYGDVFYSDVLEASIALLKYYSYSKENFFEMLQEFTNPNLKYKSISNHIKRRKI